MRSTFQLDDFILGQQLIAPVGSHLVQFLEALDRLLHGDPVGEQSAQPALVDVRHTGAVRFFRNRILSLTLGADEKNRLAARAKIGDIIRRVLEHLQRLLQVDDVNAVALAKDVFLHLRIPTLGLMPEVHTCFEQFLHSDGRQWISLWLLHPGWRSPGPD